MLMNESDWEGVRADAATGGDEPVELARDLLGRAIVIADADRVSAAAWAKERFGVTAFVLDDAFQHRRAKRDIDVVCVDATNPFGNGRVLPAGTLRESVNALRRADAAVITRSLVVSTDGLAADLKMRNRSLRIFRAVTKIRGYIWLDDILNGPAASAADAHAPELPFVFCGLGNPENFRRQLGRAGIRFAGFRAFQDHHRYSQADADGLADTAEGLGATELLTTVKDAVKLGGLKWRIPVLAAAIETELDDVEGYGRLIAGTE
jgi:tetraacyldisaccharide 4'-kinase